MTVPGIHHSIPASRYHADDLADAPTLSAGIAKLLNTHSPLHAWHAHPRLNPDHQPVERTHFDLGSVAHILLLQGEEFYDLVEVVDAPDWRTKAAKEQQAAARAAGLHPILAKDWARTLEMVHAVQLHLAELDLKPTPLTEGVPEQTLVWEEGEGVVCRARLDWLHDDFRAIDDVKTTAGSANPLDWGRRTFWGIGCDIQSAFYLRGLKKLTGQTAAFRFIVAECQPPYGVSIVTPGASALDLGERKVEHAIRVWRDCLERDEWPSYSTEQAVVDIEAWQEADFLRRTWSPEEATA